MYKVELNNEKLVVFYNDEIILSGVSPVIYFDDKTVLEPKLNNFFSQDDMTKLGESKKYVFEYIDEKDEVNFQLNFHCFHDFLYTTIELKVKSEDIGAKYRCIESIGGVRLKVESLSSIQGLMANYMHSDWWTRPHFDKDISKLPPRTQSLLWKDEKSYNYLLPVCDDIFKTELCGKEKHIEILLSPYDSGHTNFVATSFFIGTGDNPFDLSKKLVEMGLKLLGSGGKTRGQRRYPDMLEYFGWCSWDAFYYDINEKGIMDKAEEFKKLGVPAKWFIVDAGWSDDVDYHLNSFKPNKVKFPEGFGGIIEKLKEEYGLEWVGVWHTMIGYWNGIYDKGPIATEMPQSLYKTKAGKLIPYPEASRAFEFWNKWHSYLRNEGVDFVKVDYQSCLVNMLKNNVSIGKATKEAHGALEASVGKNFDNRMINCMGMGSENLWHRPMSSISRNSDDFFPSKKDSFKEHALQNAYNSFFTSNFIWGDWDMWWTNHEQAVNNGVLRAISGGPIYVSDPVGTTVAEQLWPVMLKDGRILRCDQNALPTVDCLMVNPLEEKIPLKLWNKVKETYVIACFNINIREEEVVGNISLKDIPGYESSRYLVHEHFTGETRIMDEESQWEIKHSNNELSLFTLVPVKGKFLPLGLINKYIAVAAVDFYYSTEYKLLVRLKEGGLFGFASEVMPKSILVNGKKGAFTKEKGLLIVDCSDEEGNVIIEIQ
ncbi:MAG: Sip1-related alpha-galactosidase [Clostridium sp.]|uniref:Sip1-related alpha-galactosidase n=1 Tax=Clostridium sp. TaxID=1506 RepID=UPI003D6D5E44